MKKKILIAASVIVAAGLGFALGNEKCRETLIKGVSGVFKKKAEAQDQQSEQQPQPQERERKNNYNYSKPRYNNGGQKEV